MIYFIILTKLGDFQKVWRMWKSFWWFSYDASDTFAPCFQLSSLFQIGAGMVNSPAKPAIGRHYFDLVILTSAWMSSRAIYHFLHRGFSTRYPDQGSLIRAWPYCRVLNFSFDSLELSYPGWWFQTFFIFHNIWDNPSHWLSYFSRWLLHHQPDTSWQMVTIGDLYYVILLHTPRMVFRKIHQLNTWVFSALSAVWRCHDV